jgi:hypothetical protein
VTVAVKLPAAVLNCLVPPTISPVWWIVMVATQLRGSGLAAHPVEVYCACPPELAIKRYNARTSHPVHVVTTLHLNDMAEYDRPVGIGTLVTVDTTVPVDVPAVAAAVRARSR